VYGVVPPAAASIVEYAVPTVPLGRLVVEIIRTGLIVMANVNAAVCGVPSESVTFTVKVDVPTTVGVPEITPDDSFNVRPDGRAPDEMLHV
jgi:hypothetical protein